MSSLTTTHGLITDLVNEGKIVMEKPHSQVQFLKINEKSEYNRIYEELSEIENIIYELSRFRRVLTQDEHRFDKEDLDLSFVIPLADVLNTFLRDDA